ncbi:hypothetical protein KY358_03335 [Candidatus Woesearchaeota archaeon]|nr:hypothetical protein [Candidatus Woesearchaeota archaeon]
MGNLINVFDNVEALEPKCPGCKAKIVLGLTTRYDKGHKCHVCLKCSSRLL